MTERLKQRWMRLLLAAMGAVLLLAGGGIFACVYRQCVRESGWELAAALILAEGGALPTPGERGNPLSPAARWGMRRCCAWRGRSCSRRRILA